MSDFFAIVAGLIAVYIVVRLLVGIVFPGITL